MKMMAAKHRLHNQSFPTICQCFVDLQCLGCLASVSLTEIGLQVYRACAALIVLATFTGLWAA